MSEKLFLSGKTMAVIGGGQGWGAKIVGAARRLADEVTIIEKETDAANRETMLRQADVVFLATPDTEISSILQETRTLLTGKCMLDCATNKHTFASLLQEMGAEISICSTHPMVRSETPSRGQTVLVMPVGPLAIDATKAAEELFRSLEMRIHQFDFGHHGEMMAIVQFIPHITQRILIQVLGVLLQAEELSLGDIQAIAPANFQMTELGMGRVGIQRPDVSAGIIEAGLQSDIGKRIIELVRQELENLRSSHGRSVLSMRFSEGMERLDPNGNWRQRMAEVTDVHLEARANFNACSFVLDVTNDEPGLLLRICTILQEQGINMTAVHSHVIESAHGKGVRFNIGIEEEGVDWAELEARLNTQKNWSFARRK